MGEGLVLRHTYASIVLTHRQMPRVQGEVYNACLFKRKYIHGLRDITRQYSIYLVSPRTWGQFLRTHVKTNKQTKQACSCNLSTGTTKQVGLWDKLVSSRTMRGPISKKLGDDPWGTTAEVVLWSLHICAHTETDFRHSPKSRQFSVLGVRHCSRAQVSTEYQELRGKHTQWRDPRGLYQQESWCLL